MSLVLVNADALHIPLADGSVHCVVTSPPYWGLRDYGIDGQLGLEHTPAEYVEKMVQVFREVKRVLRDDGTVFLNLGDSYYGSGKGPTGYNGIGDQTKRQGFYSASCSRSYVIIRENLTLEETYEAALGIQRYMPELWRTCWQETREGSLCEMLPEEIQGGTSRKGAGISAQVLPQRPQEILGSNSQKMGSEEGGGDSANGGEMCLLRGNGTDIPVLGSHQGRRKKGSREGGRPTRGLEAGNSGRIAKGQIPSSLLELQFGIRFIRFLSSLKLDISEIPAPVKIYFREVTNLKPKDLVGIPWRVAFALQEDGWYLRSDITWIKGNPMPESVRDRPTKASEMLFLLSKSPRYFWDAGAVRGLSYSLNPSNSFDKKAVITQATPPIGFSTQSRDIAHNRQFPPYFIFATFLASQPETVKERNNNFRQILDAFQSPMTDWTRFFERIKLSQSTAQIIIDILENWKIVISELNLNSDPKFWIRFGATLTKAIISIKTTLTVEQTDEIVSKLISNMKILRQTFPLDTILKGSIDVDFVNQAVSFFDCSYAFTRTGSDSLITQALSEKLSLLIENIMRDLRTINVGHDIFSLPGNYTTQPPSSGRNILDWWYINTFAFPGAHFATYPPALVEPCIKAGTSEHGVCPVCGRQWVRMTVGESNWQERKMNGAGSGSLTVGHNTEHGKGMSHDLYSNRRSTGWQPTCAHDAEPIPATVLDPFVGSGTTLLVARALGRNAVGLDLSYPYLHDQARKRLELDKLKAWMGS